MLRELQGKTSAEGQTSTVMKQSKTVEGVKAEVLGDGWFTTCTT